MLERLARTDPPRDWLEFFVRLFFGAIAGLVIGLVIWARLLPSLALGWLAVPVAALAFGLAAAYFGDRAWECLLFLRWWD